MNEKPLVMTTHPWRETIQAWTYYYNNIYALRRSGDPINVKYTELETF